ncbi:hypothetical protein [Streptomyces avermitilis]|uniref:hypothetical protein n=1 Tax=Streptomyces avermitilis TaxID=33903 RepID=UPI0033BABF2A
MAALFLTATSCSTEGDASTSAADGCEEALGDSGIEWVESHADVAGGGELDRGGVDLKDARAQHYKQMESGGSDGSHWSSELCTITAFDAGKKKELKVEFGPSSLPFDFQTKGAEEGTITPVNSDVKLHQVEDSRGVVQYGIYVKCKIPGTSSRQETETPGGRHDRHPHQRYIGPRPHEVSLALGTGDGRRPGVPERTHDPR